MRATTTLLENNRVMLTVEIDDLEMDEAMDAAAKTLSKQVSVKGFRKGKVPKNVLIANIGGPSVLRSEAIRESLPDFYARAVADSLIDPIGQPDINITAGEDEGLLTFEAEVEVRPEISIKGQRELRVTIPSPVVTDAEVDAQINRYLQTDAVLNPVERPIVTGDLVTMDVHVQPIATEAEPLDMTDFMYTVGSGSIAEGVDDLILGLKAGEELKLNAPFGDGSVATFELTLKQVQERVLPELSDEWVAENSEWTSAEEMRDEILAQMRRRKIIEAQMSQRDAALIALSELVAEGAAPDVLINTETNERLHELGERLAAQKLTLEMYLQVTNQTPEDLLTTLRQDALRAVRVDLAMRALVAAEHLEATSEEIDEELERTAEAMGVSSDLLRTNLRDSGRVVSFAAEVSKMKASKWLSENVTYVDPEGVEIDNAMLRANQSVGGDEMESDDVETGDDTDDSAESDA
ncbi:MAG TPA: trigger factor [Acidimicrobiales bacterium]|nr:trigger factor [Acidimicrobiales bacterium]